MDLAKWIRKIDDNHLLGQSSFQHEIQPVRILCPKTDEVIATESVERLELGLYRKTVVTTKGDYKWMETYRRINVEMQNGRVISVYKKLD